jgi:DNA processing protein
VENVDDVLEELDALVTCAASARQPGLPRHSRPTREPLQEPFMFPVLSPEEQQVWDAIGEGRISVDQVVARARLSIQDVLSTISRLELRRLVRRVSGAWIERQRGGKS